MRRLFLRRTLGLLVTAYISACAPGAPAALSEADVEAIRTTARAYEQAGKDTAWSQWATFFMEDAVFLPPNTGPQRGRPAIEAWARTFPPIQDIRLEPVEVDGRGDLAYVWGRYFLIVVPPGMPASADFGKYIEIWRKQQNGGWKLFRDMFNSDIPLPPPAQSK